VESLEALKTTRVDIFYLHAPDTATPFVDTLREVDAMYREGKFAEFGLSNFAAWQVMDIWHLCKQHDWVLPTVYQGMYNAITRDVESELFPCLRQLGIRFYAYNPIAGGLLSDRSLDSVSAVVETGSRFDASTLQGTWYRQRYVNETWIGEAVKIRQACQQAGIPTSDAALRWMVHHSKLDPRLGDGVILGASSYNQAKVNLDVMQSESPLPESVVTAFDASWQVVRGVCPSYFHRK